MEKPRPDIWKYDTDFWKKEIIDAGVKDRMPFFNDVLTGKKAPVGYGEAMVEDVILDGKVCDVYHTDREGGGTARVFIHIKSEIES